jgi:hypothetical protein
MEYPHLYPPTPAFAKAGAAPGTTAGVEPVPFPGFHTPKTVRGSFDQALRPQHLLHLKQLSLRFSLRLDLAHWPMPCIRTGPEITFMMTSVHAKPPPARRMSLQAHATPRSSFSSHTARTESRGSDPDPLKPYPL